MKRGLSYAVVGLFAVGCSGPAGSVGPQASTAVPTLSPIYFGAGTTVLGREQRKLVDAHAVWLRRAGHRMLLIEGHTDGPADHLLSIDIGEQRARATKVYLVSKGMAADHIALASHGGGRPTCVERTAACRAANRRVTFSIKSD